MKGYFSRLIQQTGITIADTPAQSFVQQNNTIPQIHVDRERISHQEAMEEKKNSENHSENSEISRLNSKKKDIPQPLENRFSQKLMTIKEPVESSIKIKENERIEQPIKGRFESKLSQEPIKQEPEDEISAFLSIQKNNMEEILGNKDNDGLRNQETEEKNADISRKSQSISTRNKSEPKNNDLLEGEAENDIPGKPGQSEGMEYYEGNALRSVAKTNDPIAKQRQAYLGEMRGWVAGTLPSKNEEVKRKDAIEMEQKKRNNEARDIARDISTSSYPAFRQRPDNDIQLSIGTISVIVEEPQKKEPPQVIKVDSSSAQDIGTSRLIRHYIRM